MRIPQKKVQWLDLSSWLWSALKGCPLQRQFMPILQSLCNFQGRHLVLNIRFILDSSSLKEV
jgi:hypothetical protein